MSTLEIKQTENQQIIDEILKNAILIKEIEREVDINDDDFIGGLPVDGDIGAIPLSFIDSPLNKCIPLFNKYFPNNKNKRAIQPILKVSRCSNGNLLIFIMATVYGNGKLQSPEFYYNFSLDSAGNLQLDIYFNFNRLTQVVYNVNNYNCFPYLLYFPSNFQPSSFGTVRAFLIDGDPVTSRGTVTTVQTS